MPSGIAERRAGIRPIAALARSGIRGLPSEQPCRPCACRHTTDTRRDLYKRTVLTDRARKTRNEGEENLARESRSRGRNGIPLQQIAEPYGRALVACTGMFPAVPQRPDTAVVSGWRRLYSRPGPCMRIVRSGRL